MQTIVLDEHRPFSQNSEQKNINKNQMYKISTQVIGKEGKPFCSYFGVVFLQDNKEIDRKICWLNDFSGDKKKMEIICNAITDQIILIYRINQETPVKSKCSLEITPINEITVEQTIQTQQKHDKIDDYVLPRPRELTSAEEEKVERNLVWVLGSPRGGTTWVGTQLLSHNTNVIDEFSIALHIGAIIDTKQGQSSRYIDFRQKDNHFYVFAKQYKEIWQYYLRKLILNRIFSQFPDALEKITIIKEPDVTGVADIISKCLPNCKIILLLRDGRDVIDSAMAARGEQGFMAKGGLKQIQLEDRLNFIKKRSEIWVAMIQNMQRAYEIHSKVYKIKYEDIRKNPMEYTRKLYEFIGIKISDDELGQVIKKYTFENIPKEMKGEGKFYRSASPGKWREHFTDKEKEIMNSVMNDTLNQLEYQI